MSPVPSADRALFQRVRAYSPISDDQRREMDTLLAWIGRQKKLGPKEEQRIADTYRAPVQTVGRAMVAGVVEYGLWLTRLQERVPPGTWMHLFRDAKAGATALLRPIPLSLKQAQAYMRIARHPVLGDPGTFDALPPHWRTLDELTRVRPALLNAAITSGQIHPEMERAEVGDLRDAMPMLPVRRAVLGRPAARATEQDVAAALDEVVSLATRAGLSAPAIARMLRARAEALEAEQDEDEAADDEEGSR
jgi:hypothetical protein